MVNFFSSVAKWIEMDFFPKKITIIRNVRQKPFSNILNMRKSYFPQTLTIKINVYFANKVVCKLQRLPTISMSSNLDVSLRSYQ